MSHLSQELTKASEGAPLCSLTVGCGRTGLAVEKDTQTSEGFDCPLHGKFKVASSVLALPTPSRANWEAALDRAKKRTADAWPMITTYDLGASAPD